jgi:hypothetical protein
LLLLPESVLVYTLVLDAVLCSVDMLLSDAAGVEVVWPAV